MSVLSVIAETIIEPLESPHVVFADVIRFKHNPLDTETFKYK